MTLQLVQTLSSTVDNPNREALEAALVSVYAGELDAVILIADEAKNLCMQVPSDGFYIEYCAGQKGPIYACDGVGQAVDLFTSYAAGDESWLNAVQWRVERKQL